MSVFKSTRVNKRKNVMQGHTKAFVARAATLAVLFAGSTAFFPASAQTAAPNLLTAGSFAVLGASTVTSAGPTDVTGDVGVSPGNALTGFSTSANVIVGAPPGTVSDGDGIVNGGS